MFNRDVPIFNAYIQEAIDTMKDRTQVGIEVNGHRIDMLQFINDIAIIAGNTYKRF